MTLLYGLAILTGAGGLLLTVAAALNPQRPSLPVLWRHGLLGVLGFGLAGMAASFGGWPTALAVLAAVGGAAVLVAIGVRYAAEEAE